MLDMKEINKEIKALESYENTNYGVCNKLAILYIIRDHYKGADAGQSIQAPVSSSPLPVNKVI